MEEKKQLELYAEELPEMSQGNVLLASTSTVSTESSALSASCPTSSASTYGTMSSFSW
jgi:hypothetical protein